MLSKESQGEKQPDLSLLLSFFFLPRLPRPDPMGSQKAKGLGITIHLGRPSRTQNRRQWELEGQLDKSQHMFLKIHIFRGRRRSVKKCQGPVYKEPKQLGYSEKAQQPLVLSPSSRFVCCGHAHVLELRDSFHTLENGLSSRFCFVSKRILESHCSYYFFQRAQHEGTRTATHRVWRLNPGHALSPFPASSVPFFPSNSMK